MPMVSWRRSSENERIQDFHPLTVHRASPQAAWMGQAAGEGMQQGPLALLMKTAAAKTSPGTPGHSSGQPGTSRTPERASRSQPASPARPRRISSDRAQQYAVSGTPAAAGAGSSSSSFSAGSSGTRNQVGFWSKTYGTRPVSNPSPSRSAAAGHLGGAGAGGGAGASGSHRAVTPGRNSSGSGAWYGSSPAAQQPPQLGDLFTAQALKVPQRMVHSPYLSSSAKAAQAASAVLQPSSPYSPKVRSGSSNNSYSSSSSIQQQQQQQQQQQEATVNGSGGLSVSSPDPISRAKLSYAFSFHRSTGSNSSSSTPGKPQAASPGSPGMGSPCDGGGGEVRPSRGPGALGSLSPHSPAHGSSSNSSSAAAARSSAFRSSRYTGSSTATGSSSPSTRQRTPPGGNSGSPSASSSTSSFALNTHKQSLRQHQQQQQQQQLRQQQQQSQQSSEHCVGLDQQHSQQYSSQVPLTINASGQLSGLSILGPSSSNSVAGRPLTAKGSSRAELRSELTPPGQATGPGSSSTSAVSIAQLGVNLDPQSWSTFLAVSAAGGAGSAAAAAGGYQGAATAAARDAAAGSGMLNGAAGAVQGAAGSGSSGVAVGHAVAGMIATGTGRSLQSQMLADLGLSSLVNNAAAGGASGAAVGSGSASSSAGNSGGSSHTVSQQASGSYGSPAAPHRQPSGGLPQSPQSVPANTASSNSSPNHLLWATSNGTAKSILQLAAETVVAATSGGGSAASPTPAAPKVQASTGGQVDARSSHHAVGDSHEDVSASGSAAAAVPGPLHAGLLRPRSGHNLLHQVQHQQPQVQPQSAQQQQQQHGSTPQHQSYLTSLQQQQQQLQQQAAAAASSGGGAYGSSTYSQQQQQQSPAGHNNSSPGTRFVQTPTGGLRRRSATEIIPNSNNTANNSPTSSIDWATSTSAAGAPASQQQHMSSGGGSSSSSLAGSPAASVSRDTILARTSEGAASVAAAMLNASGSPSLGGSSSQRDSYSLRRPSELGAGSNGSGSPLARLQSDWGTLTAMRGSGFGTGGESSTELSTDCNSTGSWGSAGGAAVCFTGSMGAAAAAGAAAGGYGAGAGVGGVPVGPGPSPLSVSSTPGSSHGAAGSYSAGGAAAAAATGAVRRALHFGEGPAGQSSSSSGGGAAAGSSAVPHGSMPAARLPSSSDMSAAAQAAATAISAAADSTVVDATARHRLSNGSSTGFQQQRTPSMTNRDGSVVSAVQAAAVSTSKAAVQQAQQQQQQEQQYMQHVKPQQQQQQLYVHQATPPASAPVAAAASPQAAVRNNAVAAQPGTATAAVRTADRGSTPAGPDSPSRRSEAAAAAAGASQQQQQAASTQQHRQQKRTATVSDSGDDYETQPVSSGPAPAPAAAPAAAGQAAAPAAAPGPAAAAATAAAAAAAPAAGDDAAESLLLPGYSVGRVVGEGGFCQVRLATHHLSRRKVAVKVIDKTKLSDHNEASRIQREIRVLKRLNHAAIIRLFEVLEAGSKLFLVMEYAPSGSLLDYVRSRKRLSEGEAAYFLQQIVAGLQYCHDNEVVHRDIKLENILLDATNNMKLIDFGLAAFYAPGKKLRVHCGSPSYAAPEIVARKLYEGPPVDVWSLGVVLFAMMAGFLPFHSPTGNKQELCQKIMAGSFNPPDWLSPAAKDLLGRMLTVDPERRITLGEVAAHPWTTGSGPAWEMPGVNCYSLPQVVAGASGADEVAADSSILSDLEAHGYPRATTLRYLAAGETNYVTASYYLLAEAKAEAVRKLLPAKPWPFQPVVIHGSSRSGSGSSSSRTGQRTAAPSSGSAAAAGSRHSGSAQAAAAGGSSNYAVRQMQPGTAPVTVS